MVKFCLLDFAGGDIHKFRRYGFRLKQATEFK